jgi:integrin beta 3
MECPEHLVYKPCGSYCPPTCENKNPDCGKLSNKCNEGCFCPQGTYLLEGKCVPSAECKCIFKGDIKEVSINSIHIIGEIISFLYAFEAIT